MKRPAPSGRAVGYVRVSTDQQRESGLGLDAQRASITETAARLGLDLVATYADAGLSGARNVEERPGLADALNAIRRGDVLIVAKRDRIARDALISVLIEREVGKKGGRIVSAAGEGTDTDDPSAVFTRRILDAVGELERALTAARTRAALRAKRARGERAGTEPFGYRVNGERRTLHPDAAEQAILAVIHDCRAAGYSHQAVADELNRRQLRTRAGSPWRYEYVRSLLATLARHAPKGGNPRAAPA